MRFRARQQTRYATVNCVVRNPLQTDVIHTIASESSGCRQIRYILRDRMVCQWTGRDMPLLGFHNPPALHDCTYMNVNNIMLDVTERFALIYIYICMSY